MRKLTLFILALYLCTCTVFAEPTASPSPTPSPEPQVSQPYSGSAYITILHTSDIHGNIQRSKEKGTLGYSGIAAIQKSLPESILVDGGDYLTSELFMAQNTADDVLSLMNTVGYHLAAIGESDLRNGVSVLQDIQKNAAFHMLSSNITAGTERKPLLASTKILETKGIKLGFFSILNPELRLASGLEEMTDIYLEDASKTAQNCVNSLKAEGADVIIALTHMGTTGSTSVDQLAAFVTGIDFIFDGHDHQEENGRFIGDTLIMNPGGNGEKLLQLDLKFGANKQLLSFSTTQWSYEATESLPLDETIVNLENSIIQAQSEFLNEGVAVSSVELSYGDDIGYRSTALGNFVADAYREKTKATVALVDAGSIGAGVRGGSVTKADILAILPKNHGIQTKKITPKELKTALESAVSGIKLKEDGTIDPESATEKFPQISGFQLSVNLKNEPGDRVVRIKLDNGVSLNLNDDRNTFTIASNSGVLAGGNDYDIFALSPLYEEYGAEGQALLEYLNYSDEYPEHSAERVVMTNQQKNYTGLILNILVSVLAVVVMLIVVIKMMTKVA